MQPVSGSTSHSTGTAPSRKSGATVAWKLYDGTITSSPGRTPTAWKAMCSAAVPLAAPSAYRAPW